MTLQLESLKVHRIPLPPKVPPSLWEKLEETWWLLYSHVLRYLSKTPTVSNGTPAEKLLRATLFGFGIRYRTTDKLGGLRPTLTLPSCKAAVFVVDCFEGRCPTCHPTRKSVKADRLIRDYDATYKKKGWMILRIWQHEVERAPRFIAGQLAMILRTVQKVIQEVQ